MAVSYAVGPAADHVRERYEKGVTVVSGLQTITPPAVGGNGQYIHWISCNLSQQQGTRIRDIMSKYSLYKLRKFTVHWSPTVAATTAGKLLGGSLAATASISDYTKSLPVTNGGFVAAIYRNAVGRVDTRHYFDRWRPVYDATDEGAPFNYILQTPSNNLVTDGVIRVAYEMELSEPVVGDGIAPPWAEKQLITAVLDEDKRCLFEEVTVSSGEGVRFRVEELLDNINVLDIDGEGAYAGAGTSSIGSGRVLDLYKSVNSSGLIDGMTAKLGKGYLANHIGSVLGSMIHFSL
jgi:hypothetical protein